MASGDLDPSGPQFKIGLFDPIGAEPYKDLFSKKREKLSLFLKYIQNIILAQWTVAVSAHRLEDKKANFWYYFIPMASFFILTILFHLLELAIHGCWAIGWFWYLSFVLSVTGVRLSARRKFGIDGNVFEDFFSSLFFYPCVAVQLDLTTKEFD